MKAKTPYGKWVEDVAERRAEILTEFLYWRGVVVKEQGVPHPETEVAAAILTAVALVQK